MDEIAPQIALLRQMYMGLDKKSRKAFLASIGHKDSHEERPAGNSTIDAFLHEKLGCHIACPDCKSETVVKWSVRKDGTRRYKCKACGRTFVLARNTVFYHAKIGLDIIMKYVEGMKEKDVLRLAAEKCGIGLKTSFFWRHKILDSLRGVMDGVRLDGIVESDETFFAISYKGARALPRDVHDRGVPASKRGLSDEKTCVPCAVNRDGKSVSMVSNLGKVSGADLDNVFAGHVAEGAVWCSDRDRSYPGFAERHDLDLIQIRSDGPRTRGAFHIQHVNAYHSGIKRMVNGHFRGVATKYLNNYLLWYNFFNYGGGTLDELTDRLAVDFTRQRRRDIWSRPALPLLRAA